MSMPIEAAMAHFLGWEYTGTDKPNRFPVVRDILPASLLWKPGDARSIDCSTFATAVLVYGFADKRKWDDRAYGDMQIFAGRDLWSPIDAWERHDLGDRLPDNECAQSWGVYQGWGKYGHQWFYNGAMQIRVHSSSRGKVGPIWERQSWEDIVEQYADGVRGVDLG